MNTKWINQKSIFGSAVIFPFKIRHALILCSLLLMLFAGPIAGCSQRAIDASPTSAPGYAYAGALDTAYENALDVTSQLALGTLNLEDTANAVTEEQAAKLLPLWRALSGSDWRRWPTATARTVGWGPNSPDYGVPATPVQYHR